VAFIGMAGLADPAAMQDFVDEFGIDFPQAVSVDGRLWAEFGVAGQPAWVFVDASGRTELYPYELSRAELEQILDSLVADKG
jgi:hypothetical protein